MSSISKLLKFIIIPVFLSGIGFVACRSTKQVEETTQPVPPAPDWVKNRPVDNGYYIGVGMSPKSGSDSRYRTRAQQIALTELAGEIEARVNVNSMLFTFERNSGFDDEYKEFVQIKTLQNIENYEVVDVYETPLEYWVYYRLSKEAYARAYAGHKSKAKVDAVAYVERASSFVVAKKYNEAIQAYFYALNKLQPFFGDTISATIDGKEVELGTYTYFALKDLLNGFYFEAIQDKPTGVWGMVPESVSFRLKDKTGDVVAGFPVKLTYSEGLIRPNKTKTDENGLVIGHLEKIRSKRVEQKISVAIDYSVLLPATDESKEWLNKLFKETGNAELSLLLHVTAPVFNVLLEIESNANNDSDKRLTNALSSFLMDKGFRFTEQADEATLNIIITGKTRLVSAQNEMYKMGFSGYFTVVVSSSNEEVYRAVIDQLFAVKSSKPEAEKDVYRKLSERVEEVEAPRFYRYYMK